MAENFDLLGDPIPANWGGRGRPEHIPTVKNRNRVILLLAMGWPDERIAGALDISKPTLKKHYFRELRFRDEARDRVEAGIIESLWLKVREGSVSAVKEFVRQLERSDLKAAGEAFHGSQRAAAAPRQKRLGKKEAAAQAAASAGEGTEWGNDLLPQSTH